VNTIENKILYNNIIMPPALPTVDFDKITTRTSFGLTSKTCLQIHGQAFNSTSEIPSVSFGTAYNYQQGVTATQYNQMASFQAEDAGLLVCDLVFYTRDGDNTGTWDTGNSSTARERLRIRSAGVDNTGTTVDVSGICQATSGFNVSSSLKYKKNITDFPNEYNLDMLMKYRPVVYKLKGDEKNNILPGFIAEELDDVGAKLFITYKDGEPDALDYSKMCVHLVKSIQEMKTDYDNKLDEMQTMIDELKELVSVS
jgi:hypothetical protein